MNWTYLGIAALLPLTIALAATLLAGAIQAIRSNRQGGSSRVAFHRLLRTLALVFPLAFLLASLWDGRSTWRGLIGAALGRPSDQRAMGLLRSQGEGFLARDPAKAAHWFRSAARQGDGLSQHYLAVALVTGTGVPRDPEEALQWAEAAARQGETDAMILAGDLQKSGNPAVAETWYRLAIKTLQPRLDRRESQACLTFGFLLASGRGVPRDPVESLAWMMVAERQGLPPLQPLMIRMMENKMAPTQREEASRRAKILEAENAR